MVPISHGRQHEATLKQVITDKLDTCAVRQVVGHGYEVQMLVLQKWCTASAEKCILERENETWVYIPDDIMAQAKDFSLAFDSVVAVPHITPYSNRRNTTTLTASSVLHRQLPIQSARTSLLDSHSSLSSRRNGEYGFSAQRSCHSNSKKHT